MKFFCLLVILLQAQAIIVGLLAAILAMILGWVPQQKFNLMHGFLLCTGSVLTAAVASFILGTVGIPLIDHFCTYVCIISYSQTPIMKTTDYHARCC